MKTEHMNPNHLEALLNLQRGLMLSLGFTEPLQTDIMSDPVFKDVLIMLAGEVQEALAPITVSTKPWKQVNPDIRRADCIDEVVDCLFFLLEAFLLIGLTPDEIMTRYIDKWKYNMSKRLGVMLDDQETISSPGRESENHQAATS